MTAVVGAISVVPFVLGVIVALNVMGPPQTAAAAVPSRAVDLSGDALATRQQSPDLTSAVVPVQRDPMPELQTVAIQGRQQVRRVGNLIQTSLVRDGTAERLEAVTGMSRRAFAASSATTQDLAGSRIDVVEPGDSLAYISVQFYGRPNAYPRIFEANREQLRSPDLIQVGQRLIIPR